MRAFFGKPELPLVISSRAVFNPSKVRITVRVHIPSPAGLPLGNGVTLMIAASPHARTNPLGPISTVGISPECGVPEESTPLAGTHRNDLSATATLSFSIGKEDPSCPTHLGLLHQWHPKKMFVVHAERKAPSSNLLGVCRVQVVCAGSEALSVCRFNDYTGARSCWDLPEGLHCDVLIVFLEAA